MSRGVEEKIPVVLSIGYLEARTYQPCEQSGGHGPIGKEPTPQARHVALPRDAERRRLCRRKRVGCGKPPGGA